VSLEKESLAFLANPARWPAYPFLPLLKGDFGEGTDEVGVLYADGKPVIYRTNLFTLPKTVEEFRALPQSCYGSFADILADGWRID
jgi:hypothetical protein